MSEVRENGVYRKETGGWVVLFGRIARKANNRTKARKIARMKLLPITPKGTLSEAEIKAEVKTRKSFPIRGYCNREWENLCIGEIVWIDVETKKDSRRLYMSAYMHKRNCLKVLLILKSSTQIHQLYLESEELNEICKPKLQIRLTDVSNFIPNAGFEVGDIYNVYGKTEIGYNILCSKFGTIIHILFEECELVDPGKEDYEN